MSATSSRRYSRRHLANRSQIGRSDQGFVTDARRQMASTATAVAPSPRHIEELKDSTRRHFTEKRFADAPISLASKKAIHHE